MITVEQIRSAIINHPDASDASTPDRNVPFYYLSNVRICGVYEREQSGQHIFTGTIQYAVFYRDEDNYHIFRNAVISILGFSTTEFGGHPFSRDTYLRVSNDMNDLLSCIVHQLYLCRQT